MESEFKNKLQELASGYTFRHGIISNPGKFEGESLATLYYYDCYLDGQGEVMQLSDEERKEFRLDESDKWVYVDESNDGFISLVYFPDEDSANNYAYEASGVDIEEIDSLDEDY